jgi:hypothetical protein
MQWSPFLSDYLYNFKKRRETSLIRSNLSLKQQGFFASNRDTDAPIS